jgi:hypothetical protein
MAIFNSNVSLPEGRLGIFPVIRIHERSPLNFSWNMGQVIVNVTMA